MGKKQYVIESQFEDLHGNADEAPDLEVDLSDSDNPIIKAALSNDENWTPPKDDQNDEKDEATDEDGGDEDEDLDDEDDDSLEDSEDDEVEDDEDDDQAEDDADDEEEDDTSSYSKRVQKRIEREREARRRDKEVADRRIRSLEKKVELRDARDEYLKTKTEAESKLKALRKQKIEALDEGETEKAVDIDDEILDIKADLKSKEIELKQAERDIESTDEPESDSGTPAEGRKFLEKYPQFHSNKQFRDVLLLADKAVAARGFDKNTTRYYAEIEKILQPQFPEIVKRPTKIVTKPSKKRRSAVGSTTKAGTRRTSASKTRSRRGVVRLTKTDQQQMVIFGMDPTNPVDAKAWAENKGS